MLLVGGAIISVQEVIAMSLRRSPVLTPAALRARRLNSLKSTGPRSEPGKARTALNALRHGRYAVGLPERLGRAGYVRDEAEWHKIRARIAQVFEPTFGFREERGLAEPQPDNNSGFEKMGPRLEKKMDRLANWVWCSHRSWRQPGGTNLESPLESMASRVRVSHAVAGTALRTAGWIPPQIRIHNPYVRLGLVFYAQRRRGWMLQQLTDLIVAWGISSAAAPGHAAGATGSATLPPLDLASEMETGLRSKVYELGRPRFWERYRYCLDREGNYHPELRGRFRQYCRELRAAGLGMFLEPHPIRALLRQEAAKAAGTPGVLGGLG